MVAEIYAAAALFYLPFTRMISFCIRNCYYIVSIFMPNGATSIIIYPAFDIHGDKQGREGLRGKIPPFSIWGGR